MLLKHVVVTCLFVAMAAAHMASCRMGILLATLPAIAGWLSHNSRSFSRSVKQASKLPSDPEIIVLKISNEVILNFFAQTVRIKLVSPQAA